MTKSTTNNRIIGIILLTFLMTFAVFFAGSVDVHAATVSISSATAKVDSEDGAFLRAKASTTSKQIKLLKDNTKLTIAKEVFDNKNEIGATHRWYYVTAGKKKGYIRADLVDTIKYSSKTVKTTADVNYRKGPSTTMEVAGGFEKGTKIKVVLKANLKGKSTVWYKVKRDSKYYYVCGKYVKEVTNKTSKKTTKKTTKTPTKPTFTKEGMCYPISLSQGAPFSLSGTINCDMTIDKIQVGAVNSSGDWVSGVNKTVSVDAKSFDIKTVDADIKFAKLAVGKYTYRACAVVDGTTYTVFEKAFEVKKTSGPTLLANTALALVWPLGTDASLYKYKKDNTGGTATPAYQTALDAAYPKRNASWKYDASKLGASCDVFIGTVCVYSGYDTTMSHALKTQWNSGFDDTSKWTKVNTGNERMPESEYRNGDIIVYLNSAKNKGHICMYIKQDGQGYIAEAAFESKYAYINKNVNSRINPNAEYTLFAVYRAAK